MLVRVVLVLIGNLEIWIIWRCAAWPLMVEIHCCFISVCSGILCVNIVMERRNKKLQSIRLGVMFQLRLMVLRTFVMLRSFRVVYWKLAWSDGLRMDYLSSMQWMFRSISLLVRLVASLVKSLNTSLMTSWIGYSFSY